MILHEPPLIDEGVIQMRVQELALQLDADYQDRNPLMLAVLKGAFFFAADLLRAMTIPHEMAFISCKSYAGMESTGAVRLKLDGISDVRGRHVVIVEDIVDTGGTAAALMQALRENAPASLALCTLLDKPVRRMVPATPDYIGFTIDDAFVVGYGLDYNEQYRSLKAIHVASEGDASGEDGKADMSRE